MLTAGNAELCRLAPELDADSGLRSSSLLSPQVAGGRLHSRRSRRFSATEFTAAAVDAEGGTIGTVVAVENYGAGDLLEIELRDGKRSLIPFKPGIADLDDGRIVLDEEFLA